MPALKIDVVKARTYADARDTLADLCAELAGELTSMKEFNAGKDWPAIRLILGGDDEAAKWDVSKDAIGFFAVCSRRRYDSAEDEENDQDGYYEVNETLEAHVNLDAAWREIGARWCERDEIDKTSDLFGFAVTAPHELLHALDWMRETGGKTPLQVFDEGGDELALRAVLDKIDHRHGDTEDAVESLARDLTELMMPYSRCVEVCERIDAALSGSPRP